MGFKLGGQIISIDWNDGNSARNFLWVGMCQPERSTCPLQWVSHGLKYQL